MESDEQTPGRRPVALHSLPSLDAVEEAEGVFSSIADLNLTGDQQVERLLAQLRMVE